MPTLSCLIVKTAVDAWLKSDQWFHLMRDSYSHTELILAGMWGGCTGIFHNIEAHIRDYVATGRYPDNRVIDQHYLRYCIWPTLKQSVLVHDSQQFDENSADFPVYDLTSMQNDQDNFHVGMDNGSPVVTTAVNHPTAEKFTGFYSMKITMKFADMMQLCRRVEILK